MASAVTAASAWMNSGRLIERCCPANLDPALEGELLRLDVEVVKDLQVVGDETDWANQHLLCARSLDCL